ncbi:carboxylating nicotinate-nucleotide diphosphorylase [Corynebacterium hindlerae]|uniref:carboxylating nicotinate-nucleotide diphosphorylase n=1 Tax=Corynebacterium hindlerae TaxID=699041 RepID=UPI003AAF4470
MSDFGPALALDLADARTVIRVALDEDLAYGPDITTRATVGETQRATAKIVSRAHGTVAGLALIDAVLSEVSTTEDYHVELHLSDGDRVEPGTAVATIECPTRTLLTAERTMLNLLTHLGGVATATAEWVDAVAGTGTKIRDSRKTLPMMRKLQKYAVRAGGGENHRMGLGDRAMIKDNHVVAAGSVVEALRCVRLEYPDVWCEVEVDTLAQLDEILTESPDEVLLDNFDLWEVQIAVQRRNALSPSTLLEASGGLRLEHAADYAKCGVDFLAVGSLTHSVRALDLGLDFE